LERDLDTEKTEKEVIITNRDTEFVRLNKIIEDLNT